jgi:hypothetical protein
MTVDRAVVYGVLPTWWCRDWRCAGGRRAPEWRDRGHQCGRDCAVPVGVRPEPAHERFESPGWWYEEPAPLPCPRCGGVLHALRKEYDGTNRNPDKPSFLVAVVCPGCPATFTLQALKKRSYVALMDREEPPKRRQPRRPLLECDVPPGEMRVRSLTLRGDEVRQYVEELLGAPRPGMFARTPRPLEPDLVVERRLLHWWWSAGCCTGARSPTRRRPLPRSCPGWMSGCCCRPGRSSPSCAPGYTRRGCRTGRCGTGWKPKRSARWGSGRIGATAGERGVVGGHQPGPASHQQRPSC